VSLADGRAVTRAALGALVICVVAAALEGLFAGRGVRRRLAELRQPAHSPPFGAWVLIGLCYYLICFLVLSRLIDSTPSPLRGLALALVLTLLMGNAVWNLLFFRHRNIEATAILSVVYAAVALGLTVVLVLVDSGSALVFLPYLIYLAYGTWWVLALRRLNPGVAAEVT
jgi:benzodiazapine receptor